MMGEAKDSLRAQGPARARVRAFDPAWGSAEWLALARFTGGDSFPASPGRLESLLRNLTRHRVSATFAGREALSLAALLGGLGPGDELLCPSFTCPSSVRPFLGAGCSLAFADIGPDLCIDPESARSVVSGATRAILMVHQFGQAARVRELQELATERSLLLLDDAANAFGPILDGRMLGTLGDWGIFSFNYGKIISSVGGGALVLGPESPDPAPLPVPQTRAVLGKAMQCVARSLRGSGLSTALSFARSRPSTQAVGDAGAPASQLSRPRWIAGIQAELALIQIRKAGEMARARKANRRILEECLGGIEGISLICSSEASSNPYLPILVDRGHRYDLARRLAKEGYQSTWDYYPLHMQGLGKVRGALPVTEDVWRRILLLPLGPSNKEERVAQMGHLVASWARHG